MGQQQLLLLVLSFIAAGLAIAIGVVLFQGNVNIANRDAIINDLNNLGQNAFQYKIRPITLGGGNSSYVGFTIPDAWGSMNDNAVYSISGTPTDTFIAFHAESKPVPGATVDMSFDGSGETTGPVSQGF
jgi:hypothetical protein